MTAPGPDQRHSIAARYEHYVPVVYLKTFVDTSKGANSTYSYDKFKRTSKLRNISNIAGEKNFYEMPGVTPGAIEDYLGKLESKFGPVRDKLLDSEDIDSLSDEERRVVASFTAIQLVRTSEYRSAIKDMAAETKSVLRGEKVSPELTREIENAQTEESIQALHLSMLDDVPAMTGKILTMKWVVIVNKSKMPFWTSDHPVNRRNGLKPLGGDIGLDNPGVQLYLPLSPTFSLTFCDYLSHIYEPDKHITTDIEPVIFQNDWQLRESNKYVFSNVDDFSLARRITEDIPEIVDPNRRRVKAEIVSGEELRRRFPPP